MNEIIQYVNGSGSRKKQRVGVLIGERHGERVIITGAKVNLSAKDQFHPHAALEVARGRQITVLGGRNNKIAASFKYDLIRFEDRCKRYFKVQDVEVPELAYSESMVHVSCP